MNCLIKFAILVWPKETREIEYYNEKGELLKEVKFKNGKPI